MFIHAANFLEPRKNPPELRPHRQWPALRHADIFAANPGCRKLAFLLITQSDNPRYHCPTAICAAAQSSIARTMAEARFSTSSLTKICATYFSTVRGLK
jgi:hypothetical protein